MPPSLRLCSVIALLCISASVADAQHRAAPAINFSIHDSPTAPKSAAPLIVFEIHGPRPVCDQPAPEITFAIHGPSAASSAMASPAASVCTCGCGRPNCDCQAVAAKSQIAKPTIQMRSASWCSVCNRAKEEICAVKDCPFDLEVISDEDSRVPLPIITWRVAGKLWTTPDPSTGKASGGYTNYAALLANWKATQRAPVRTNAGGVTVGIDSDTRPGQDVCDSAIADSVTRHFVARLQSPPAGLSKPNDSPKKNNANSIGGSNTNAADSAEKSRQPSSRSTARPSASTPSPGGRS